LWFFMLPPKAGYGVISASGLMIGVSGGA
jgi:hypothetical protein